MCSLLVLPVFAQKKALLIHAEKQKVLELKVGHRVALLYTGYRGQVEFACEMVSDITDSTITIGLKDGLLGSSKKGKQNYKTIAIKDIQGFRRMTLGRQLAKTAFTIGGVVGSFYLLRGVYSSNLSNWSSFAISLGVGLGLYELNALIFPENIKYFMDEGWTIAVVDPS